MVKRKGGKDGGEETIHTSILYGKQFFSLVICTIYIELKRFNRWLDVGLNYVGRWVDSDLLESGYLVV